MPAAKSVRRRGCPPIGATEEAGIFIAEAAHIIHEALKDDKDKKCERLNVHKCEAMKR